MKIETQFHGVLADWVGAPSASFELSEGATYADLIQAINRRYRRSMPDQLWDQENDRFHSKVRAFRKGRAVDAMDLQLLDGEELTFYLMMAGG